jgi:hypothetical protein
MRSRDWNRRNRWRLLHPVMICMRRYERGVTGEGGECHLGTFLVMSLSTNPCPRHVVCVQECNYNLASIYAYVMTCYRVLY